MKTARVAHPILQHSAWNVPLSGFIEVREQRERTDRIVVRVHSIEGRLRDAPERVRLSVKKRTAPPVGTFVQVKARLNPPLRPLRPGGYDFSRDLYFQRIGATGFVTGAIRIAEPPVPPSAWVRYATVIAKMRAVIDTRIRAALSGDAGGDRVGADHRQARRDFGAGQRRDVHLQPRPCALDLRLPHGGGRGRRVLCGARAARARRRCWRCATRSRNGRRSRRSARPSSICCCPARKSRRSARSS